MKTDVYVRSLYRGFRVPVWLVRNAARVALRRHRKKGPVSIVFVSARRMRKLNKQFTGRDETTDVLAFPTRDELDSLLGEVFVNADAVMETADKLGIHPNIEAVFLAVHGVLHLVGLKDKTPAQRKKMLDAQLKVLEEMGYHASILDVLRRSMQ